MNCKTAPVRAWRANTPEGEIIRVVCAAHTHSRIAETFRQNWANGHLCHPLLAEWAYSNSTLATEERFRYRPELTVHFAIPAADRYGELEQLQQLLREEPAEWETDQAIRRQRMAEEDRARQCRLLASWYRAQQTSANTAADRHREQWHARYRKPDEDALDGARAPWFIRLLGQWL